MKHLFPLFFTLVFAGAGCPNTPSPIGTTCALVCAHGAELSCVFAKPTPKGASCETVCANLQASGLPKWNLACRSKAPTCAAADLCERGQ